MLDNNRNYKKVEMKMLLSNVVVEKWSAYGTPLFFMCVTIKGMVPNGISSTLSIMYAH